MENQLSAMILQELSLKHELSSLGRRFNINSLNTGKGNLWSN
jgi:hypothetical protein